VRLQDTYRRARQQAVRRLAAWRHRPFSISRSPADEGRSYEFMMCATFRNDADYLREWIEYHRALGAEKFVLFDNSSVDDFRSVLDPYVASGVVSLHHLPRSRPTYEFYRRVQLHAYDACLDQYRDRARWIAFLDLDEFLNPLEAGSLPELMADFESYPALAVHWVMFSSSGYILQPDSLVTEAYTACDAKGSHRVKVIVDPRRTVRFLSPHHAQYADGALAVNELEAPVAGDEAYPPTVSRVQVNHYYTRSVEEFLRKYRRNLGYKSGHKNLAELVKAERDYAADTDTSIQRFVPALRAALEP
jgi:hypothetical protein